MRKQIKQNTDKFEDRNVNCNARNEKLIANLPPLSEIAKAIAIANNPYKLQ